MHPSTVSMHVFSKYNKLEHLKSNGVEERMPVLIECMGLCFYCGMKYIERAVRAGFRF